MTKLLPTILNLSLIPPLLRKKGLFCIDETIGTGLVFSSIFKERGGNYALISTNQYSAQKLYEFLLNFLPEENLVFFPSDELLRAEALTSSRELLSQRLYAMGQLLDGKDKILITHPSALLRFLPDPEKFKSAIKEMRVGDTYDLRMLKSELIDMGYQAVNKVEHSLQFASRGDILDIYSVSYLDPIRVEFFGDEIESIRTFDIQSQRSKLTLSTATILPASDLILDDDETTSFVERAQAQMEEDKKLLDPGEYQELRAVVGSDLEKIVGHNYRNELYKYYGFAMQKSFSVLSYFSPDIVYITSKNQFDDSVANLTNESRAYFRELFYNGKAFSHLEQYMRVEAALGDPKRIVYSNPFVAKEGTHLLSAHRITLVGSNLALIVPTIQSYLATNKKVILSLPEPRQKNTVIGFLQDAGIEFEETRDFDFPSGQLGITEKPLTEGFELPSLSVAFLSSTELFGRRGSSSRFTSRFKDATILKSYEDLKPGDYVVHEYNGIGQFLDIKTIEVDGVHRDFLHVAYAGNEFLYIPLEQFRLVRKYSGREGVAPKLSRLSSGEWEKRKSKIKQRVNELADRLIALYGDRARSEGFAFPADDELNVQFENEFPYPLTPDQQKALDEIKADMEKNEIMDRLLCGDVGFGKTEVAFRAAFKAINGGKQVAMLAPTTLLARQHYELALQRFSSFGIKIGMLSRLVSDKDQKELMKSMAAGSIDFVIGTHRLLSKDFAFKDLGLLIVDEEQRFGVEQKEKIKELKKNVDVLTLSATPIPRTLQMSLVGIRPLSEINTAPSARMPIQTYVTPYKEEVVTELISRELARDGQVFYLHNKIETIYAKAAKIAAHVPEASVGVVHGQMDKEQVEEVMERFYENEINVLVCTSIVENGIDVPNANMIIVENADTFGLSQLYQIKGRVGRGDRIAYAYLMYREHKNMKEDAQKRLQAIQEFTELGSGYKIAQRDLMIRGAGDILGPEQAGFIDSIGLDLYLKMLNEAVKERQKGEVELPPAPKKMFSIDAYIPQGYASKSDKITLYQELEAVTSETELAAYKKRVRDIYGRLPEEVESLIQKKKIDLYSDREEFESIEENDGYVDVLLSSELSHMNGIGNDLFNVLVPFMKILKVTFSDKKLLFRIYKGEKWMEDLEKILKLTHKVYTSRKERDQ